MEAWRGETQFCCVWGQGGGTDFSLSCWSHSSGDLRDPDAVMDDIEGSVMSEAAFRLERERGAGGRCP